jgi:hypothetical protein
VPHRSGAAVIQSFFRRQKNSGDFGLERDFRKAEGVPVVVEG